MKRNILDNFSYDISQIQNDLNLQLQKCNMQPKKNAYQQSFFASFLFGFKVTNKDINQENFSTWKPYVMGGEMISNSIPS